MTVAPDRRPTVFQASVIPGTSYGIRLVLQHYGEGFPQLCLRVLAPAVGVATQPCEMVRCRITSVGLPNPHY